MKRIVFALLLCLCLAGVASAATQPTSGNCGANMRWNLNRETGLLTITGSGEMESYQYSAPWYWTENRNCVKEIVVSQGITGISDTAFCALPNLTSVTLPGTITSLGDEVFMNDISLTTVVMPGVISLGTRCFSGCSSLAAVSFSESLHTIGEYCFEKCAFEEIRFPGTLNTVGKYALRNCNALKTVVFAEGFTGEGCAAGSFNAIQSGVTTFHLPDTFSNSDSSLFNPLGSSFFARTDSDAAKAVGSMGFSFRDAADAHSMVKTHVYSEEDGSYLGLRLDKIEDETWTDVTVPDGFTIIGNAFPDSVTRVVFPDTVTMLDGGLFQACTDLTSVRLPSGITMIPGSAFAGCTSLATLEIPSGVQRIGPFAFYGCSALQNISLPDGVQTLGISAFQSSGIVSVSLPETLTDIGEACFADCYSLETVHLPSSLTSLGKEAFRGCGSLTGTLVIPVGVTVLEDSCFYNCGQLGGISLPEGLERIGSRAFMSCASLTNLDIPSTVTSMGSYAFYGCAGIEEIRLPVGVTALPDFCLAATGMRTFTVPAGIQFLGDHLFEGSSQLTSVIFPEQMTALPNAIFRGCEALTDVCLPDGLTRIGSYAFDGCISLTQIEIPATVTDIQSGAFSGCEGLVRFTWPSAVTTIQGYMFENCISLRQLIIPDTVTAIRDEAFYGCIRLHSLYLPSAITELGTVDSDQNVTFFFSRNADYLIERCEEDGIRYFLTDAAEEIIQLPPDLTEIQPEAFRGTAAQEYRIPETCHLIGSKAFAELPTGTVIVFMGRDAEIAADAFDKSDIFFVCPYGGSVLTYLQLMGYPVYVTYYSR